MRSEDEALIDSVAEEIYRRLGDRSIFSLPWAPQVVVVMIATQGIVDNGGFIYFFEQDWTGNPHYSVFANAYRAIGAEECADCIKVAASLFPVPDPHLAWETRRDYLKRNCMIGDRPDSSSILVKLGDRVIDHSETNYSLLAEYIRLNLNEIRS